MTLVVNLKKAEQSLKLCLAKAGITTPPRVDLAFALDVSKSFEDEHEQGITNDLMMRLVPWGMLFDPDKKLDVFTFSDGPHSVVAVGAIDENNYVNFVRNKIIGKVRGWCGATDYSYVLEAILKSFGWIGGQFKGGLLGRLFGAKPVEKKRSLAIVVTDGENYDPDRTRDILRESAARQDEVYFLFIGVSNQKCQFEFIKEIGDEFPNTGFVPIYDLRGFVQKSDEELNAELLDKELLDWLKR